MVTVNKKRERLDVIYDILEKIKDNKNSILPTPLMRKANLSSSSFGEYYKELSEKGFIKEIICDDSKKYLTLTDKGFKYLERYSQMKRFIEEFEL